MDQWLKVPSPFPVVIPDQWLISLKYLWSSYASVKHYYLYRSSNTLTCSRVYSRLLLMGKMNLEHRQKKRTTVTIFLSSSPASSRETVLCRLPFFFFFPQQLVSDTQSGTIEEVPSVSIFTKTAPQETWHQLVGHTEKLNLGADLWLYLYTFPNLMSATKIYLVHCSSLPYHTFQRGNRNTDGLFATGQKPRPIIISSNAIGGSVCSGV